MTDAGVVRSDDHGKSWQVVADTTLRFTELATARDGSIIGHRWSREYERADDGATLKLFSEGLPDYPISPVIFR